MQFSFVCVCVCVCVCSDGIEVHCQKQEVKGNMPPFWDWVQYAKSNGTFTFHEVVYDEWVFYVSVIIIHVCSCKVRAPI